MAAEPVRIVVLALALVTSAIAAPPPVDPGYDAWGGWRGIATTATGRFRTERIDGVWWLVTPDGHAFYSMGVTGVRPEGDFAPPVGRTTVTESGSTRTIVVTDLPVDGKIGDWPMTQYPAPTTIDPNPGTPAAREQSFSIPIAPVEAQDPSCVSLGAIGVTLNGVVVYNAADATEKLRVDYGITNWAGLDSTLFQPVFNVLVDWLDENSPTHPSSATAAPAAAAPEAAAAATPSQASTQPAPQPEQ